MLEHVESICLNVSKKMKSERSFLSIVCDHRPFSLIARRGTRFDLAVITPPILECAMTRTHSHLPRFCFKWPSEVFRRKLIQLNNLGSLIDSLPRRLIDS